MHYYNRLFLTCKLFGAANLLDQLVSHFLISCAQTELYNVGGELLVAQSADLGLDCREDGPAKFDVPSL